MCLHKAISTIAFNSHNIRSVLCSCAFDFSQSQEAATSQILVWKADAFPWGGSSHSQVFFHDLTVLTFVQFADLRQFQELTAFKMGVTPVKDCKDPFKRTEGGVAVLVLLGLSNFFLRSYLCHFLVTWQVFLILAEQYLYT